MGNILAQLFRTLFGRKEMRVVMVGLDAAGKTTILYKLKLGEVVATIPTIGFNVETVVHKNVSFTVWDLCSQDKIRPLWKHYFHDARHVVFVVDSNDRERIGEVREELNRLLGEEELRDAALLVLANKQDVPSAMDAAEIADRLGLPSLQDRNWHVQAASAVTGDGLYEGLDWLANPLPGRKPAHRPPSTASQTEDTSVATGLPLEGGGALETTEGEGAAVGSARILPITDKRHSENKT